MADIPGLIRDASTGHGLGHIFLRHVERCAVLLHLVDVLPTDESDPLENFLTVEAELRAYAVELAEKPRLVVFTKADLVDAGVLETLRCRFIAHDPELTILMISSATGAGIQELPWVIMPYVRRARERADALLSLVSAPTRAGRGSTKRRDDDDVEDEDEDVIDECDEDVDESDDTDDTDDVDDAGQDVPMDSRDAWLALSKRAGGARTAVTDRGDA